MYYTKIGGEGGFEPPIGLRLCRISSAVLSTAQPPLQLIEVIVDSGYGRKENSRFAIQRSTIFLV